MPTIKETFDRIEQETSCGISSAVEMLDDLIYSPGEMLNASTLEVIKRSLSTAEDRILSAMAQHMEEAGQTNVRSADNGETAVPIVGSMGHDQDKVKLHGRATDDRAPACAFDALLASLGAAEELAKRQPEDSEQERAAYGVMDDTFAAVMACRVDNAADLKAKLETFAAYRADAWQEPRWKAEIGYLIADAEELASSGDKTQAGFVTIRSSSLEEYVERVRDVRHSLVGLSMSDGLEDWQQGSLDVLVRTLEQAVDALRFLIWNDAPDYGHMLPAGLYDTRDDDMAQEPEPAA